jgi:phenylalanyl-tRNA synthetase beta chain
MQISFNWLKEYVDFNLDPYGIANLLTMAGSEVERVVKVGTGLEGVVVGQITSVTCHPHADKLSLCTVDSGSGTLSIVCGASNITPGDKVPLALEGTQLPNGTIIKPVKIRGERSQGMLCSEVELALGNDTSGIMILPPHLKVGHPLASALTLEDYSIEINLTPNRSDCLSVIGIAREIAAITHQPLRIPPLNLKEKGIDTAQLISVTIQDPDLCPRYTARVISKVKVGPSPLWMRRRLETCGVRSINNVVDVTNYLLLEMGQPLHAFDLELLDQKKIVVKRATPGAFFTTLDGKERELSPDALMVCDGATPIALGGIMGGSNSEITARTTSLLLESAYFTPTGIFKTSKKMGLRTESSQRFEKGVDLCGVPLVLHRAAQFIAELAGGEVNPGYIDNYPLPLPPPPAITLSAARTNTILGTTFTADHMKQTLEDLAFSVREQEGDHLSAAPPSWRVDIKEEIDLIEEIARISGYDHIAASLPLSSSPPHKIPRAGLLEEKIKESLTQQGCYEVITYSFISPQELANLHLSPHDVRLTPLHILNPLTEEQSVMRTTLIPGLLTTVKKNLDQKNLNLKLFEVGTTFLTHPQGKLPEEKKMLAAVATGLHEEEEWNRKKRGVDLYDLKGLVENLLAILHISHYSFTPCQGTPLLHPLKALHLVINHEPVGVVGELHPQVLEAFQIPQTVYLLEIPFTTLLTHSSEYRMFRPLPKHPAIYRDIALLVDETISAQKVYDTMYKFKNKFIEEITIFDYYRGKSIPVGKKSLAYRLKYQSYDRTLTDKEVNALFEELVNVLHQELGAEIRT